MSMTTLRASPWILVALLMCGCLSSTHWGITHEPRQTLRTAALGLTMPTHDGLRTTIKVLARDAPTMVIFRTPDSEGWSRVASTIEHTLNLLDTDTPARIVEIVLRDRNDATAPLESIKDTRRTRLYPTASQSRDLLHALNIDQLHTPLAYVVVANGEAHYLDLEYRGSGHFVDFAQGLPVGYAIVGEQSHLVKRRFGEPRVPARFEGGGFNNHFEYSYTNETTGHRCTTGFTIENGRVRKAGTCRELINPAKIYFWYRGDDFDAELLAKASIEPIDISSLDSAVTYISSADLVDVDRTGTAGPGNMTESPAELEPGRYRIRVDTGLSEQNGTLTLRTILHIEAGDDITLDLHEFIREAAKAPPE